LFISDSRVHFDEDGYIPVLQEANPIQVQVVGEERSRTVALYLGFLQEEHRYALTATIPLEMCGDFLQRMSSTNSSNNGSANAAGANGGGGGPDGSNSEGRHSPELVEKGKYCDVSSMMWMSEDTSENRKGLEIQMEVTVPSTTTLEGHNVFEDAMKICGKGIHDSFLRVNVSAKVMGKYCNLERMRFPVGYPLISVYTWLFSEF